MANSQAMTASFKSEIMSGVHTLGIVSTTTKGGSTSPDTVKAALFLAGAPGGILGASTTVYSTSGEVSGTNYSQGGVSVTNSSGNWPQFTNTTAYWTPSASIVFTNVTLTTAFDAVLLYNSSQQNRSISVHTFGSQTVTAGNFTLTMPSNDTGNALVRIS